MRRILSLLLLIIAVYSATALTSEEVNALQQFASAFPGLAEIDPRWASGILTACDRPSLRGITCTEDDDPHVLKLEFDFELRGSIPEHIGGLSWLEVLSISQADLKGIVPTSIGRLQNLKNFTLIQALTREEDNENTLGLIPDEITQLGLLESLKIDASAKCRLPERIGKLRSLKHLWFRQSGQNISHIPGSHLLPSSFNQLSQLESLHLTIENVNFDLKMLSCFPVLRSIDIDNRQPSGHFILKTIPNSDETQILPAFCSSQSSAFPSSYDATFSPADSASLQNRGETSTYALLPAKPPVNPDGSVTITIKPNYFGSYEKNGTTSRSAMMTSTVKNVEYQFSQDRPDPSIVTSESLQGPESYWPVPDIPSPNPPSVSPSSPKYDVFRIKSDSCLYSLLHRVYEESNCKGVSFNIPSIRQHILNTDPIADQCAPGSSGRLCSKCLCDSDMCFSPEGSLCSLCPTTFSPIIMVAIGLASLSVITVLFAAISIANTLLKGNGSPESRRLSALNGFLRLFKIAIGNECGYITITYMQAMLVLTPFSNRLLDIMKALLVVDMNVLTCSKLLSEPLPQVIVGGTIIISVIVSILLGIWIGELFKRRRERNYIEYQKVDKDLEISASMDPNETERIGTSSDGGSSINNTFLDNDSDDGLIEIDRHPRARNHYDKSSTVIIGEPIKRYVISQKNLTIRSYLGALRFFYFGVSLTIHRFLFWDAEEGTENIYARNTPWLEYSDSGILYKLSIGLAIFYDVLVPIVVGLCCVVAYGHPDTSQDGVGGDNYKGINRCWWWEVWTLLRKTILAIGILMVSESPEVQSTLIASAIAISLSLQLVLSPWRLELSNGLEFFNSVILLALLPSRSTQVARLDMGVSYTIVLWVFFVLANSIAFVARVVIGNREPLPVFAAIHDAPKMPQQDGDYDIDIQLDSEEDVRQPFALDEEDELQGETDGSTSSIPELPPLPPTPSEKSYMEEFTMSEDEFDEGHPRHLHRDVGDISDLQPVVGPRDAYIMKDDMGDSMNI